MKKYFCSRHLVPGVCTSILALLAFAHVATAQPLVVPNLTLNAPGLQVAGSHTPDQAAFQLGADGKTWELRTPGSIHFPGAPWLTVQELRFDPDPLIYGNVLVQNTTAIAQTYTFGFSLPTTWSSPNLIRGSIDTSIIGTDASLSALANSAVYTALIDGNPVHMLQSSPFTISTPQSANSSSAAFGFDLSNIAVNSSIGIQIKFQLSPGDVAAIISDFEVVAVPEPSGLALMALGGVFLIWRRRS